MTSQRVLAALAELNVVLLVATVVTRIPPLGADTHPDPILRGRGLEIVDDHGQVVNSTVKCNARPESVCRGAHAIVA